MSKRNFTLWSPHREENSVLSFKALLGLRPNELWTWHDEAQSASLWVVDGGGASMPELTQALHARKAKGPAFAVLLAQDWSLVKDPVWTFIKIPLRVSHVYRWIDSVLPQLPGAAVVNSWAGQRLRLKRWPNMSSFTQGASMADSMALTVACAQLLKEGTLYEDAKAMAGNTGLLDALLLQALEDGMLECGVGAVVSAGGTEPTAARQQQTAPATPQEQSAWSLVKRLIQKFK
jgi:hypothetical protein